VKPLASYAFIGHSTIMDNQSIDTRVVIIGTGFSGIAAAIELGRQGIGDFVMLEKAADIGGTWRDNQYPGACCDVPSVLYSLSYEQNPNWSRKYSPAPEIHAYQHHVMDKYGLRNRTRTGFEVASADWQDDHWLVTSTSGETIRATHVISAIGALHIPFKPDIKGLKNFKGKVMHSAEWDHDYDFKDQNVVVVGSAASGVQIVPEVAKTARRVTVMQRTPNYFVPRDDQAFSNLSKTLFKTLPFTQRLQRWWQYCFNDVFFLSAFKNGDSYLKRYVSKMIEDHQKKQVKDPDMLAKIKPDYVAGCKRILLSDDFLPTLAMDSVDLVTEPIDHFREMKLVTKAGTEIEADLVVLATGFETTKMMGHMMVTGPSGQTVQSAWKDGIKAHRSVAIAGFPNFFMMYGPGSNLGHSSIIIMFEAEAKLIANLIKTADDCGVTIEPCPNAQAAWNERLQSALSERVWATDCDSWYKDEHGRIFSLWPWSTTRFIREMKRTPLSEFILRKTAKS